MRPQRVVSLVPSVTESLFDLGLGASVVGITDYCIHPAQQLIRLPKVGGPKDADLASVLRLQPDLVIANPEENDRRLVEALQQSGIHVHLAMPKTVSDAIADLWQLAGIFESDEASLKLTMLEKQIEWTEMAFGDRPKTTYFCPVWQEKFNSEMYWMTFNQETYPADVLRIFGGENCFAERERRYPLEADLNLASAEDPQGKDTRYPRVTVVEVKSANPDVILLPDEPYSFSENDADQIMDLLSDTKAVQNGNVCFIVGSLFMWHGTRIAKALEELVNLFPGNE